MRIGIVALALLALLPALAQAPAAPVPTPLKGTVTVIGPDWQFYSTLGAKEQIKVGAEYVVMRGNTVYGRARVIEVGMLDSIAVLLPEYRTIVPAAGDTVVVQSTPVNTGMPGLPWFEPEMEFGDLERAYTFFAIVAIGLTIFD